MPPGMSSPPGRRLVEPEPVRPARPASSLSRNARTLPAPSSPRPPRRRRTLDAARGPSRAESGTALASRATLEREPERPMPPGMSSHPGRRLVEPEPARLARRSNPPALRIGRRILSAWLSSSPPGAWHPPRAVELTGHPPARVEREPERLALVAPEPASRAGPRRARAGSPRRSPQRPGSPRPPRASPSLSPRVRPLGEPARERNVEPGRAPAPARAGG